MGSLWVFDDCLGLHYDGVFLTDANGFLERLVPSALELFAWHLTRPAFGAFTHCDIPPADRAAASSE
jgi:hypothetical protein